MLVDFEKCLIYGDYESIGGAEHWDDINAEYLKLIKDEGAIQMIYQVVNMHKVDHYIARISMLLENICLVYSEGIADMIRQEFKYPLTQESYANDCKKISNQLKTKAIERDRLLKDIEKSKDGENGDKIDGTYFDTALERYSAIRGFSVTKQEITTQQFCIKMRELNEYIKEQNKNAR